MAARAARGLRVTTILVTGATGYIGRRLCAALRAEGDVRVRAMVRRPGEGPWDECVAGDLPDRVPDDAFAGVDAVIHAAGRAHVRGDDAAFERVNADGTARVAEAARRAGVDRFVLAGSVAAVGEGRAGRIAIDAPCCPLDAYGRSKRDAESAARTAIPGSIVVRLPMVYGPGAPGNLARMIRAVRAGWFPPPPRGTGKRSMIHVDDAVSALCAVARSPRAAGRTYVATDGVGWTAREVWEAIVRALGREPPRRATPRAALALLAAAGEAAGRLVRRPMPFDRRAYVRLFGPAEFDDTAIRDELGWRPSRRLDEAMPEIVAALG